MLTTVLHNYYTINNFVLQTPTILVYIYLLPVLLLTRQVHWLDMNKNEKGTNKNRHFSYVCLG